jgi:hypothetical protein
MPVTWARATQEQCEGVPLLAGQRRSGSGQPGDVCIQPGLTIIIGLPVWSWHSSGWLCTARGGHDLAGPGWAV